MGEPNRRAVESIDGLRQIADRYDGFILDQWGVLHDGQTAYPGAVDCLRHLKSLGKCTVVLSNSGKRAYANEGRLASLGFDPGTYNRLITSGDIAWEGLKRKVHPFYRKLGHRCLLISNDQDQSIVQRLAYILVGDIDSADFILLAGAGDLKEPSDCDRFLSAALKRRLPLLCANPDLTRLVDGGLALGCGAIAKSYERMGGEVHYVGKPHPEVYQSCRTFFEERYAKRIVAIGDSLQHDVAGGTAAGFDTVFVSNGIHRDHFVTAVDQETQQSRLSELVGSHCDRRPRWMLSTLRW